MKSKFKYGIFDLDGTIYDAMPSYAEVYSGILDKKFNISPERAVEYYLESAGMPLSEQFRHMLELSGKPVDEIPQMVDDFFHLIDEKNFLLFNGADEFVKNLNSLHLTLFLTTGTKDDIAKKRLEKNGLLKYFTLVLGSSQKEKGPWHIERFAIEAKTSVREFSKHAFYIGDGPFDMQLAKMFNIYAIGIATTVSKNLLLESGADEVIDKIADIEKSDMFIK